MLRGFCGIHIILHLVEMLLPIYYPRSPCPSGSPSYSQRGARHTFWIWLWYVLPQCESRHLVASLEDSSRVPSPTLKRSSVLALSWADCFLQFLHERVVDVRLDLVCPNFPLHSDRGMALIPGLVEIKPLVSLISNFRPTASACPSGSRSAPARIALSAILVDLSASTTCRGSPART